MRILTKAEAVPKNLNQPVSKARLAWLDILKGMGIILVAIGHIYQNDVVYDWIYSFHMPLFFLAAGWVYKVTPVVEHIKKRFFTVIVPYFSFGLLVLLYWQLLERRFRDSDMTFAEALIGLLRGQYDYLDFNVHLWFLPCFFVTVVLYNILVNIHKKKWLAYGVCFLMSAVFVLVEMPELPWGLNRVFQYIGFYALGDILGSAKADSVLSGAHKAVWFAAEMALLALNFGLAYFDLTKGIMWFVTGTVGVASCILFSVRIRKCAPLEYLGRISLTVLCIHGPVYRVLVKIVSVPLNMSTDEVRANAALALVVTAVTLAICSLAYEIIIRILPWMVGAKKSVKKTAA
ncbi:MAG: acyltransferase family protein [Ruminococcus sp.]|nr:acyltransferase family protein [Ruminococcus sp.]